jgi:hypothetical protein
VCKSFSDSRNRPSLLYSLDPVNFGPPSVRAKSLNMEPIGFAVGIISLAGLFTNVIDCFEYVHLGRTLGSDLQTSLLKLDNARLRLSRWGEAMGLNEVDEKGPFLNDASLTEPSVLHARKLLEEILNQFRKAEKVSAEYAAIKQPSDESLDSYSETTELSPVGAFVHNRLRDLSAKRRGQLSLKKRAKWALHDREHFAEMIANITQFTNELVELFPAARAQQMKLRDKELLDLTEAFRILKDAIQGQDELLASALGNLLRPVVSPFFIYFALELTFIQNENYNFHVTGGVVGLQQGQNRGTITQHIGRF